MPSTQSTMSLRQRATIALLAVVLSIPAGCAGLLLLLDRGFGDDSAHGGAAPISIMLFATAALAAMFIYEVGRRITRNRIDGRRFSILSVAAGTVLGLFAGLWFVAEAPVVAGGAFAFLGAFLGTFITPSASATRESTE